MSEVLDFPADRRLPSKRTGQSGRHTKAERGRELYPTPHVLTRAFLKSVPIPRIVWEPTAGLGHMVDELRAAGKTVYATDLYPYRTQKEPMARADIVPGVDFFLIDEMDTNADAIITNPPFSMAQAFVEHALTVCPLVYVLSRLSFLESESRVELHANHLTSVHYFIERAPMMHRWEECPDGLWREWQGKRSGSSVAHAWFCFQQRKTRLPTIQGISWKRYATPEELERYRAEAAEARRTANQTHKGTGEA